MRHIRQNLPALSEDGKVLQRVQSLDLLGFILTDDRTKERPR